MTPPSWLELLVRMTAGEQEERPFVGVLEVADEVETSWPSRVRVFKDRERYRVESLDGRVLTIRNAEHTFVFRDEHDEDCPDDVPHRYDNLDGEYVRPGAYGNVIERREPRDWRGDDFTIPTGPAAAVTFLGHDAWQIELAPPEHKPSPLVVTIDAANGMTYEQRSALFGVLSRWTQLEVVDSHDDALFVWNGDAAWYTGEWREVSVEEEQQWERERAAWMAERGIGPLRVSTTLELHVHEQEEDDGFFASFDASSHGFVARRRRSDEPWDLDVDYPHLDRWSDSTWEWCVGSQDGPEQLAEIRRQLAEPRHEDG
jgi:hypothetical protein